MDNSDEAFSHTIPKTKIFMANDNGFEEVDKISLSFRSEH